MISSRIPIASAIFSKRQTSPYKQSSSWLSATERLASRCPDSISISLRSNPSRKLDFEHSSKETKVQVFQRIKLLFSSAVPQWIRSPACSRVNLRMFRSYITAALINVYKTSVLGFGIWFSRHGTPHMIIMLYIVVVCKVKRNLKFCY